MPGGDWRKGFCLLWLEREGMTEIFESPVYSEQGVDGSASWICQFPAMWLSAGYLASPDLSLLISKMGVFALLPTLMRKWI